MAKNEKNLSSLGKSLSEANRKARLKDLQNEQILSREEMETANELQAKANLAGMKLVPERRVKNSTPFAQFMQKNWRYLNEQEYTTTAEKAFLIDIMPYLGFGSNCIVENPEAKQQLPLTQEGIGKIIGKNKSQMSKIVAPLVKKGILEKTQGAIEDNNVKSFAIYVNPHIIYSGDRDNINATLQTMFQRHMKNKILKNLPVRFF
ncbi:MarR family transcriptional regulator [Priestia megaterium]|uniref:MarR family transcriptional regulator n=1 Tax=Priestia megaterium TaxID=1404 RepID=UPI0035B61658